MKNIKKIIVAISIFALCVIGAFKLTKVLKSDISEPVQPSVPSFIEEPDTMKDVPVDTTEIDTSSESPIVPEPLPSKPITVNKMSAGEFQRLLIEGNVNYRTNKRIAKFVKVHTQGLREGDRPIDNGDVMGVYMKISNDQWESVRVLKVDYDEENRINSVIIQPVYSDNQSTEEE